MFNAGQRPAVNAGLSVSRVGGAAQTKIIKKLGSSVRLDLAQYRELAAFTQFSSDLDEATFRQIERGKRVTELMKQDQFAPLTVGLMATSLYAANKGHLDNVDVRKITHFEKELHAYMLREHLPLLEKIDAKGEYTDEIQSGLEAA